MNGRDAIERQTLSHSVRVAILDLLSEDGRALTASQIQAELPGSPTLGSVNYHLRILRYSRLVVAEDDCFKLFPEPPQP